MKRDLAKALLDDQQRLTSSVRVPQTNLTKLEVAVTEYKTAVSTVIVASEDADNKMVYKKKLTAQMQQLDPILNN